MRRWSAIERAVARTPGISSIYPAISGSSSSWARRKGPTGKASGLRPISRRADRAVSTAHRLAIQTLRAGAAEPMRAQILRNVANGSIENLSSFEFGKAGCAAR
jgi:hypothetical protein